MSKQFPRDELFGLTSQLRRAAASIPGNIAEGCGREGDPELKRFMTIALGSACELDYLIMLATELGYIETKTAEDLAVAVMEVRRMLGGFIKKLKA